MAAFDLLANPFAVLAATARTGIADLPALAARIGRPEADAALLTLLDPSSRLAAELSFLPGVDEAAALLVLDMLGGDVDDESLAQLPPLPPAAWANLMAHLCSGRYRVGDDVERLVLAQRPSDDPALQATIDADRAVAGVPPADPTALRAAQDALATSHAEALLAGWDRYSDPEAYYDRLLDAVSAGIPLSFVRKVTEAWQRQHRDDGDAELADAAGEYRWHSNHVAEARTALLDNPSWLRVREVCEAVRDWWNAASWHHGIIGHPDAAETERVVQPWREAVDELARDDYPDLALPLAETLAEVFRFAPGVAERLQDDVRRVTRLAKEQKRD